MLDFRVQYCQGHASKCHKERKTIMLTAKLNSTCLDEVTYDTDRHDLTLTFAHGGRYRYFDVPEVVFHELVTAPSAGRAFHRIVRNEYATERLC